MAYLGTPSATKEIINKYSFAFQKKFGQNFLIDSNVLESIIRGAEITKDDFVLEIINRVGVPLLVPSANLSGQPSCTTSEEVLKQLDGRIDAVVLGESGASTASTVCDTTGDELKILRQGPIKLEDLEASI